MSNIPSDKVIAAFIMLRDQRSELKRQFEAADDELKEKQRKCQVYLLQQMESVGSNQLKGEQGIAFRQINQKFSLSDWPAYWQYCVDNGRSDMVQKRIGEKAVKDLLEESGALPPGVSVYQEYEVVVRRG
jgi:hypothetical protein